MHAGAEEYGNKFSAENKERTAMKKGHAVYA